MARTGDGAGGISEAVGGAAAFVLLVLRARAGVFFAGAIFFTRGFFTRGVSMGGVSDSEAGVLRWGIPNFRFMNRAIVIDVLI